MSEASRESYNESKNYRRIEYREERYVPDSSLIEEQVLQDAAREDLGDSLYNPSAIIQGLGFALPGSGQITIADGALWAFGRVENIPGATLAYDPAKVIGDDVVYAKWLMDIVTQSEDATLSHPATGEAIDERLRTRTTLATSSPDLFDESFENWVGSVPLNWNKVTGVSAIGYPGKFGRNSLELRHTNGTETRIERSLTLPVSTSLNVYFWVKTQEGYSNLSLLHGAYVDLERTSPVWTPTDITFATSTSWVRKSAVIVSDSNTQNVKIRIIIPSSAPTTRILIDAMLITTSALGARDLERHYLPVYIWDRSTDEVTRSVPRRSRLPMGELVPPLPGKDIEGIAQNKGLLEMLAQRTWHAHGHFRIPPGLRVRRDTLRDTSTDLGVNVMPGWAYVGGFQCRVADTRELLVPKALTFMSVAGENDAFAFGTNIYGLNKAEGVDLFPIKEITSLQITYEEIVSVTKGADGSIDDTGVSAVSSIQSASAGTQGSIVGTATSFTFTESANTFTVSVSPYAGGAVGASQSIVFSFGTYTIAQILEALNHGSGVAYKSGKIVGNVLFENDGSGHVRVRTKTQSSTSTVTIDSGNANTILGFTNSASNTGTGTHYVETTAWVRSGNSIDWVAGQTQPSNGSSYSAVVRSTVTLALNTDYRLGGAFVAQADYAYKVTAVVSGTEGQASSASTTITTPIGGINRIVWASVGSAQSYGIYRSDNGSAYRLLKFVDSTPLVFLDDGSMTPNASINPPGSGSAGPTVVFVVANSVGVINLNPVGKMPVDGSNLVADYDYYQPYIASVVLNQLGNPKLILGDPDDHPAPPIIGIGVMELAQLLIGANSTSITILDIKKHDRVPMTELRTAMDRINKLEVQNLRQLVIEDLRNRGDGSTHKGRIAEGFDDEVGLDLTYSSGGVTSNINVHPALQMASLPNTYTKPTLVVNSGSTTAVKQEEDYILPSTEGVLINQLYFTSTMQINPYAGARVPMRTIDLFPRSTNWAFNMDAATTPQQVMARRNTLFAALWRKTVGRFLPPWNADGEAIQQLSQDKIRKGLETTYKFETEPIVITVEGRGFAPINGGAGDTNIRGFFAGVAVDLTAVSPTTAGTPVGGKTTVNADSMGRFKATFTIPAAMSAGADDLFVTGGVGGGARATYTSLAFGTIVPEPPLREVTLYDPIAQSIGPWSVGKTISAIGLYFVDTVNSLAPDNTVPIYMQIRTVENGTPTRIPLATVVVDPAITQWNAPGQEVAWTETIIALPRYVYIPPNTQVAITLISASLRHRVAIAVRGQKNQFGQVLGINPYSSGVLFVSSNGATWESLQERDLAFKVYERIFSASAVLQFNSVSPSAVSRLWLASDDDVPEGTAVKWEYVLNGGATLPIAPFTKNRPSAVPTGIVLRARLSRTNSGATPRIPLNTIALVGAQRTSPGTAVSVAYPFTQTMSNALATVTAHLPAGTTMTLYVSRDDGAVWTSMGTPTDTVTLNNYWKEYQWNTPVALGGSSGVKLLRYRIELTSSSHLNYGPIIAKVGIGLT